MGFQQTIEEKNKWVASRGGKEEYGKMDEEWLDQYTFYKTFWELVKEKEYYIMSRKKVCTNIHIMLYLIKKCKGERLQWNQSLKF